MAQNPWISSEKFAGVQYRINEDRKHGATGSDRYFRIRYKIDGVLKVVALGWASGGWTEKKAFLKREEYVTAAKSGSGPASLKEERAIAQKEREALEEEERKRRLEELPFKNFFLENYLPHQTNKTDRPKSTRSVQREQSLFRLWLDPVIGKLPFKSIMQKHLIKIKSRMRDNDLSERSQLYSMQLVRQVFNHAIDNGFYSGENPIKSVKMTSPDNQRKRFLTKEEAEKLLDLVRDSSQKTWEICMLSLYCGFRAGEIFSLTWGDVNLNSGFITLQSKNTKGKRSREVFMPITIREMFLAKERGKPDDLVFPARGGGKIHQISDAFNRAVKKAGFNEGITNEYQKVVFHTLRHTHASWLVKSGIDIYVVQKVLGHQSLTTTDRYSHLDEDTLKKAANTLEQFAGKKKPVRLIRGRSV